jgi:tetratricopeptide (TPR) repeat protein
MSSVRNISPRMFLPVLALASAITALLPVQARGALQSQAPAGASGKTRSIAESQHEIVLLLIRKNDFNQAMIEANKIFQMSWPAEDEPLLLKELRYLSDQFLRHGQPALGIQLLETNFKGFKSGASRAAIWKEKGYLFKEMKKDDKALECFREAQRIEQGNPSP